ncbi:hypothetical protein FJ651_03700 [Paucihalobacter ruber]|uniref:TonB family protein n=1 Tax=Paucihalobacter ruber TaxID=2567861 RepID=A0A506PM07_9FLAO|nr:hypothetical protein [Paucihalobacter ruber]TPV34644.1 hypothetical protein FJ651_03700 [Paucihalobacter ruber]
MLITVFCTANIVLTLFLFEIKLKEEPLAETVFDFNALTEEEEQSLPKLSTTLPSTNSAFNEDQDFKDIMQNFKTVNTETPETEKELEDLNDNQNFEETLIESPEIAKLSDNDKQQFAALSEVVKNLKTNSKKQVNANSSMTYSLKDRQILSYKTPRYLCEDSGIIVVNITVNAQGMVTDTYINSTSTSKNQCLIDHALEYAANTKFSAANKASQIGSITYSFQGKN